MVVRVVETNNSHLLPKVPAQVPAQVRRMRKAAVTAIGTAAATVLGTAATMVGKHLSTMRLSPFSDFNVFDIRLDPFRFAFPIDSRVKLAGVGFRHYQS